jgi:DNA-binding LytR/AlgR family response regulator
MNIKCIVVDDEPLAIEKVKSFVEKLPFLELVAKFRNAIDALEFIRNNHVQIIFLDIQMDKLTGIEMLEKMVIRPQVILITAYNDYAIKGFELAVTDYILKPYTFERFLQAVNKAVDYIKWQQQQNVSISQSIDYLFIKSGYKIVKVFLNEIQYIEGMRDFQSIVTDNEKIIASHTMQELEKLLPGNFIRCHKSFIVSIAKINSIEHDRIRIGNNFIPIGESYKDEFYKHI